MTEPADVAAAAAAPVPGPVEAAVRADIGTLMSAHPMGEALAEMAYSLAQSLDGGDLGMATAAVSKELRATLTELARLGVENDDDLDAELSTPVRDEPDAG